MGKFKIQYNSLEFRKVVADVAVRYFLFEQVHFVEKQDDGDVLKYNVVHNRLEDVPGLLDSVGLPVLQENLVVL